MNAIEVVCPINKSPLLFHYLTTPLTHWSPHSPRLLYDVQGNIILVQSIERCNYNIADHRSAGTGLLCLNGYFRHYTTGYKEEVTYKSFVSICFSSRSCWLSHHPFRAPTKLFWSCQKTFYPCILEHLHTKQTKHRLNCFFMKVQFICVQAMTNSCTCFYPLLQYKGLYKPMARIPCSIWHVVTHLNALNTSLEIYTLA